MKETMRMLLKNMSSLHALVLFLLFFTLIQIPASAFAVKQPYIVYMGVYPHVLLEDDAVTTSPVINVEDSNYQFLSSFLGSMEKAKDAIFYSYGKHINGFAASLNEEEAAVIAKHPNVVSVFVNKGKRLHTTHSWDFMRLEHNGIVHPDSLWKKAKFGEDVIIANLDTGVWPESESFSDNGYGPVPSKWKGSCQNDTHTGVPCNRKLIGAKYFNKFYGANGGKVNSSMTSARDFNGHGSHTLSTAGGNFVPGANVFGVFNGTAKGGSPKARVASYKVCWTPIQGSECFDGDILAAFEAAIEDGVDVLSVSLGGSTLDYLEDSLVIGAFHAVKNGIVVVCSAGNDGPLPGTVTNVAPWIITVGASTLDCEFTDYVELGNGQHFKGASMAKPMPKGRLYPLISAAQAKAANASAQDAGVTGRLDKGIQAASAGAVGMILCNDESTGYEIVADPHFLPATHINYHDGLAVFAYVNSTKNPEGFITASTAKLNTKPAPFMAAFSSQGPNELTPEILKPDVTAPGVNIIAAYTEARSPTEMDFDKRRTPFTTDSGTSMSCPHVSGVAGLLKKLHPDWSPAAIKSALMTTARTRDSTLNPMLNGSYARATPFNCGAGHIRPNRAIDPGLVYDLNENDYLDFMCALGYNQTTIKLFSGSPNYHCPHTPRKASLLDFNYPSITVPNLAHGASITVSRKVKNVGSPSCATYAAHIRQPRGISVSVEPSILKFYKIGEEKSFKLTLVNKAAAAGGGCGSVSDYVFGELLWSDGRHYVRSPIVVASGVSSS